MGHCRASCNEGSEDRKVAEHCEAKDLFPNVRSSDRYCFGAN